MAVRDGDGKFIKKPLAKLDHPFLMARGAEVTTLAGEGNQIFVTAVVTADTGKAVVQTAAIEVAEDSLPYFRPQISCGP